MTAAPDSEDVRRSERARDPVLQRVRVGLTGLAAVFLLTLLAASIFGMLGQDPHGPPPPAGSAAANAAAADAVPKEPLAELGVTPGNANKTPPTAKPGAAAAVVRPGR